MNDFLAVPPKTVLERELNNPASPARTALTATYEPKGAAASAAAAAAAPVRAATRLNIPRIPPAPVTKTYPACQAGHGWTAGGNSGASNLNAAASNLNSTERVLFGDRSVKIVTNGLGAIETWATISMTAFDATAEDIRLWLWIEGAVSTIKIWLFDGTTTRSNNIYTIGGISDLSGFGVQYGRWNVLDVPISALGGTANLATISQLRVTITDNNAPATFHLANYAFVKRAHTDLFPKGVLSLTADDSFGSQWDILRPAMDAYGWRGTLYPIIDQIGAPGNLTMNQVISLHDDYGWEIGGHATTGVKHGQGLQNMTQSERLAELEAIRAWNDSYGFESTSFAYPLGSRNVAVEKDVARFFSTGRSALFNHVEPQYPANPYKMQSINAGSQNSQIATQLPNLVAGRGAGSITLHAVKASGASGNDITTAQLTTMLTNIASSGITVLPMGEVLRTLAA